MLRGVLIGLIIYFFFFNDSSTTEIYTLSLHDALPILAIGEAFCFEPESPAADFAGDSLCFHQFRRDRPQRIGYLLGQPTEVTELGCCQLDRPTIVAYQPAKLGRVGIPADLPAVAALDDAARSLGGADRLDFADRSIAWRHARGFGGSFSSCGRGAGVCFDSLCASVASSLSGGSICSSAKASPKVSPSCSRASRKAWFADARSDKEEFMEIMEMPSSTSYPKYGCHPKPKVCSCL